MTSSGVISIDPNRLVEISMASSLIREHRKRAAGGTVPILERRVKLYRLRAQFGKRT
jgi:hypothetical protein